MILSRIKDVIRFGWKHSKECIKDSECKKNRVEVFFDILYCFCKYRLWSNQYLKERFFAVPDEERNAIGNKYLMQNRHIDLWYNDYYHNRQFLNKYASEKYENSLGLRKKRLKAYIKKYGFQSDSYIEYH